jgi:hypothetical protein
MKTALSFISVFIGGILMMPLLVEPTPLTLWLSPDQVGQPAVASLFAEGRASLARASLTCGHRDAGRIPDACGAPRRFASAF